MSYRKKLAEAKAVANRAREEYPGLMERYESLCEQLDYEDTAIRILGYDADTLDLSFPAMLEDYFTAEELRALRDMIYADVLKDINKF